MSEPYRPGMFNKKILFGINKKSVFKKEDLQKKMPGLSEFPELNSQSKVNQLNQLNQVNQVNQLNQLNQVNQVNKSDNQQLKYNSVALSNKFNDAEEESLNKETSSKEDSSKEKKRLEHQFPQGWVVLKSGERYVKAEDQHEEHILIHEINKTIRSMINRWGKEKNDLNILLGSSSPYWDNLYEESDSLYED